MRDHGPRGGESSATRNWAEQDELTRFEGLWRDGDRGAIERLLDTLEPDHVEELLRLLIRAEIRLRREEGERPTDLDYLGRFPDHGDLIEAIFEGWDDPWVIDGSGETAPSPEPTKDGGASDPHAPTKLDGRTTDQGRQATGGGANGDGQAAKDGPYQAESRYKVGSFHKRGGMGEIFHAFDRELNREIVVKIIREEYAANAVIRERFDLEAEVIGKLEHPNIITIYGKGVAPDGRPSYAMPFIDGETLRDAIDRFHKDKAQRSPSEHELMFRSLIRRIIDVCNAIEYAHSRGVLHRDIKPVNVMLGKFGETLVLDWGLAKDAVQKSGVDVLDLSRWTKCGGGIDETLLTKIEGTMRYMSPEQALGKLDRIDRASDVFNLGATFYHLLTGRAPYGNPDTDLLLRQAIYCDYTPPREVCDDVPAALEKVCLTAMDRDPEKRYASARALADDLERWLADEPVSKYQEPIAAKAMRWARRHRSKVAAMVALVATLVVALTIGGFLILVEKTKADKSLELALEAGDNLLWRVSSDQLRDKPGMLGLRRDLGDDAAESSRKLLELDPLNPTVRNRHAWTCINAANNHMLMGDLDRFFEYYNQIIPIYERCVVDFPAKLGFRDYLTNSKVSKVDGLRESGQIGPALELGREAEAEAEWLFKHDPTSIRSQETLARARLQYAEVLLLVAENEKARDRLDAAIESLVRLIPADPDNPFPRFHLCFAYNLRGVVAAEDNDRTRAKHAFACAKEVLDEAMKNPGTSTFEYEYRRVILLNEQGRWQAAIGAFEEAKGTLDQSVALMARISRGYEDAPEYVAEHSWALLNRGLVLTKLGVERLDEAEKDFEQAAKLLEPFAQSKPGLIRLQSLLGRAKGALGHHYLVGRGDRERAIPLLEDAIKRQADCLGKNRRSLRDAQAIDQHKASLRLARARPGNGPAGTIPPGSR